MENDDKKTQQEEPKMPGPQGANQKPEVDVPKEEEPKMPEPQEANQKPEVDMSNEIKKGGEIPEKK